MKTFKGVKIAFGIFLCIVLIGFVFVFTTVQESVTVDLTAEQIIEDQDARYIVLDERRFQLTDEMYKEIDLDTYKTYKIVYSYNKLVSNKGKIERLEVYGKTMP